MGEKSWGCPGLFFLEKRGGPEDNFTMARGGSGKKINKIKRITAYYYETLKGSTLPSSISIGEDSDKSDSDSNLVLCDESESESESDNEERHTVIMQGIKLSARHVNRKWP